MVAMDPDAGLTMVAIKENDAQMVRQADDLFRAFMERHSVIRRADETPADSAVLGVELDAAPSGHDFVGSYGRVFDIDRPGAPGRGMAEPVDGHARIRRCSKADARC